MNLILAAVSAAAKAVPHAAAAAAGKGAKTPPVQIIQQPTAVVPPAAPHLTWFQAHLGWLTHGIAGLFLISAVSLIVLLAVQTTKQEGLSGTIGGRVESAYARAGGEEQLKRITGVVATFFVVCGTILALTGI